MYFSSSGFKFFNFNYSISSPLNQKRLGYDGTILTATHGMKRMSDIEIEKIYGRCRKKHAGSEYTQHLNEFGPQKMIDFSPLLHSFMDYFDIAAPLVCMRIVDVLDQINNGGKPMEEYYFWPDVQEGLKDMFVRTQFAADRGGYFPEVKVKVNNVPKLYAFLKL